MEASAAVLEEFNEPLQIRRFPLVPLEKGEMRVRVTHSGVCGSDLHMWRGHDERVPLPMIPGHEGVGEVAELAGTKTDLFGRELNEGDPVLWERGVMCGECYHCLVKQEPSQCPDRKTFGISFSCKEKPHFLGCYAEYLHLPAGHPVVKLDLDVERKLLVPAMCSGATAAHAADTCGLEPGDTALVVGPGPLGLFTVAEMLDRGASKVWVAGTTRSRPRLKIAEEFGATETFDSQATDPSEIRSKLRDKTRGVGVNMIVDCSGKAPVMEDWIDLVAAGGTYSLPGIATPQPDVSLDLFSQISRKNVNVQGVWVSDVRHTWRAANLVASGRYPFERIVTHTFPLEEATEALKATENREAVKAVITP